MSDRTITCALLVSLLITFVLIGQVQGVSVPYRNYNYNYWGEKTPAPQAYVPSRFVDGREMGIGRLNEPLDLHVCDQNRIYIVDSGNDRIISLDDNWNLRQIIKEFDRDGKRDSLDNPSGIYVTGGKVYVADTGNNRIVILTEDGSFVRKVGTPESDIEGVFPADFVFRPLKIGVDYALRMYVVAAGVYDGLMEFDPEGNFRGFLGAPRIAPDIIDYIWTRIATEAQRKRMALFLPIQFSNIDIDERGFLYTTASAGAVQQKEVIKRLNPSGDDVLRRAGFFPPIGDVEYPYRGMGVSVEGPSVFIDITTQDYDIYSVLDQRRGRIFSYDSYGRLLYVFGGLGNALGVFRRPVAVENIGRKFLVLDRRDGEITLFEPTPYADSIFAAIKHHNTGDYELSAESWSRVLKLNANYDLAYIGIGRTNLRQDNFQEAMINFRLGNDRSGYSEAFSLHRREVIGENFGIILTFLVVVFSIIWLFKKFNFLTRLTEKYGRMYTGEATAASDVGNKLEYRGGFWLNIYRIANSIRYSSYLIFHPFAGFWDLKHENKGNTPAAFVLLIFVGLTYVFMRQYTGFIFNPWDPTRLNIYMEMASILVPFSLWCVVNWSLTTLMDGKGSPKDIFIASSFALTPLILVNVPMTVLSNFLTLDEGALYYLMLTLAVIWSASLLFTGTMTIHSYSVSKTLKTILMIALGIGTILFIGLLFFSMWDLLWGFVNDVYREIIFRV